jgi:hypothetical protein
MRHVIIAIVGLILGSAFFQYVNHAHAETPAKNEKLVCEKTEDVAKKMNEKGFFHLLNMTNDSKVVETIWISGTSIAITAQTDDKSCLLAMMNDVTYNPDTLQALVSAYEKQKGKQKDI